MCRKLQVSINTTVYFDAVYLESLFSTRMPLYEHAVIDFIELMLNYNKCIVLFGCIC
jgi:hypothetical protein